MRLSFLLRMVVLACLFVGQGAVAGSGELVGVWREGAPVLKSGGKPFSIIEDRGKMSNAVKDSNNNYLFSESGPGVAPLVIVGTPAQIMEQLKALSSKDTKVVNKIAALPHIYMGISKYKPKERFNGVYPMHDFANQLVTAMLDFVPASEISDVATGIYSSAMTIAAGRKDKKKGKFYDEPLYLKIGYLQESGMEQIGSKEVAFSHITEVIGHNLEKAARAAKQKSPHHKKK